MTVFNSITLPNGTSIPNRLAKAAMEENMANADHAPSSGLLNLYKQWANGGVGLIITGNVMVDAAAMTGPNGVVLENDKHLTLFKEWAKVSTTHGAKIIMQINHPGRQMPAAMGQTTYAPSAVPLDLGKLSKNFSIPKAMSEENIEHVINKFINTALLAQKSGFHGVQVHAAHGYLISQFLSPSSNRRQDSWGGSIENRAKLLLNVIRGIRTKVSPTFVVAVKINSADFQRGGFSTTDAQELVKLLNNENVDLIEVSGGSYEVPAMQGVSRDENTLAREAYFLTFAQQLKALATIPVMVTGGIRRYPVAQQVLEQGLDMVGIATALAINPNLPNDWRKNQDVEVNVTPVVWKNKTLASLATMAVVKFQLKKLSENKKTKPNVSPLKAFIIQQVQTIVHTKRYKRWINGQ